MDPDRIAGLGDRLGHRFRDPDLVLRALTHASYAYENPPVTHQGPLAIVGDAALGLVVAERLFARDPGASVGEMTALRATFESDRALARWATGLELGALLRLGRGAEATSGRTRESILATTLEALLGVVYVEEGVGAVRTCVARLAADRW